MSARLSPPARVVTERLLIRCYQDGDAPFVKEAVDASLKELQVWMPWAVDDPQPVEQKVELLRGFRERFLSGEDFVYAIFAPDGSRQLGGCGLHPRVGPRAQEIGYWIRTDAAGQGLATEAAAALTRVGFELCGVDRIEIRMDPGNAPSRAIPKKLGFEEEAILKRRFEMAYGEMRDQVICSLFASEYPASPAARVQVRAFDEEGREIAMSPARAEGGS